MKEGRKRRRRRQTYAKVFKFWVVEKEVFARMRKKIMPKSIDSRLKSNGTFWRGEVNEIGTRAALTYLIFFLLLLLFRFRLSIRSEPVKIWSVFFLYFIFLSNQLRLLEVYLNVMKSNFLIIQSQYFILFFFFFCFCAQLLIANE